jgi:hypothetical protein
MVSISVSALRKAGTFVISFGFSKVGAFAAAVALPRFVDTSTYGLLELAMTVASLGAALLGLGAPGFAMRAFLLEDDPAASAIMLGHVLVLSGLGTIVGIGLVLADAGNLYVLCAGMLAFFSLQASGSAYVRMHGNVFFAGWFDALSLIATVAVTLVLWLGGMATAGSIARGILLTSLVISLGALWRIRRLAMPDWRTLIRRVIEGGTPMMLYGLSIILLFGTPRIAIGHSLGLGEVAIFSVCARVTALLLLANQMFQIGLVRYLYRLDTSSIARLFPYWMIALSVAAVGLTVVGHFGAFLIVWGTQIPVADATFVFPAIVCFTTVNIMNANVEMYINRELVSATAAKALTTIFVVLLAIGYVVMEQGWLSLKVAVGLYSLGLAAALLTQMQILRRHGMSFGWSELTLPLAAAPWLAYLFPYAH